MNLLLDTHEALWAIVDSPRLSAAARELILTPRHFQAAGYRFLPIEPDHVAAVETLPPLHQNPLDRLPVAQAQVEPMRLLRHHATLARYGEPVVPA